MRKQPRKLMPGDEIYSVAIGAMPLAPWKMKRVVDFLSDLEGMVAVHPEGDRNLLFFDTLNHAKAGRNLIEAEGNKCGTNICLFRIGADGVPEFVEGAD